VASRPRSLLRRTTWFASLAFVAFLLLPAPAGARPFLLPADDTPPVITFSIDGVLGTNDWYRGRAGGFHYIVLHWSVSDPESPILSTSGCEPAIRIDSPDTGHRWTCTATSDGGTTSVTTRTLKVDAEPPTNVQASAARPTDHNGWYNHPVDVNWGGTDVTSGIASCTSRTYSGPDDDNASTSGTCTDSAGNVSAAVGFTLSYDATRPNVASATPSRGTDHNGWYNHPVSIAWSGSDTTSGIESCSSRTYSTPDDQNASASGTCTDRAGNVSPSLGFALSYDGTAPTVAATPARSPDHAGWYNHSVGISWSGSDATSGIDSCSAPVTYSGPDGNDVSSAGSCTDEAGNRSSRTFFLDYDETPPVTTAAASRSPNAAGWYRAPLTISWNGSDRTSGVASCRSPISYSGPDTTGASMNGTCTDNAGNGSSDVFVLNYDSTAPTVTLRSGRDPDRNGWYNAPIHIDWLGSDLTSGIASCTSKTYSGPDVANGSTGGNCTDVAGNVTAPSFSLSYDATDPVVAVTAERNPDHAGWYNHPVRITWSGADATSGIDSCSAPVTYSGPDSSNASSGGHCTDRAGNSASPPPLAFKYDATAPVTSAVPSRRADANGWYNHPLRIDWRGSDPASGVASCTTQAYNGPDAGSVGKSGVCSDKAGNTSAPVAFDFRYDATAPRGLAVSPDRQPDHDGWYNHPLAVRWSALDALAGIASCTSLAYTGPDVNRTDLAGSCSDRAGNASGLLRFALSYDATAPAFKRFSLKALNDVVTLRWRLSGAKDLRIMRSPGMSKAASSAVYHGAGSAFTDRRVENYVRYRYTLTAEDAAGNTITRSAFAKPMPALFAPRPGAHVRTHASPFFAWRPVPRARYYNMQLWLDGRAVGAWWPLKARMKLPSRWRFRGARHRLEPGNYTWYVWPGRGPRKLGRYGPLVGKSTFVVG
jgi:hypothetical protein